MNAEEFNDQYKHPLWQKKRLEIMQRDSFTCTLCASKEKTLSVHHKFYANGTKLWEYPDDSMETLCSHCHEWADGIRKRLSATIGCVPLSLAPVILAYCHGLSDASKILPPPDYHKQTPTESKRGGYYNLQPSDETK